MDAELDRNTRGKKAGMLASNILSNDDPNIVAERAQWNNNTEKLVSHASGWSS